MTFDIDLRAVLVTLPPFACGRPGHRTTLGSTDVRWIPFEDVAGLVREVFP